jgi:hypothetical protein
MHPILVCSIDGDPVVWTDPIHKETCLDNIIQDSVNRLRGEALQNIFVERQDFGDSTEVRIYTRKILEWNTTDKLIRIISTIILEQFTDVKDE